MFHREVEPPAAQETAVLTHGQCLRGRRLAEVPTQTRGGRGRAVRCEPRLRPPAEAAVRLSCERGLCAGMGWGVSCSAWATELPVALDSNNFKAELNNNRLMENFS